MQSLCDLQGQLPRRHQHKTRRAIAALAIEGLQHRQGEGRCLAGAGRGLAKEVRAGDQRRDRGRLDRCRLLISQAGESTEQFRAQTEGVEGIHPCTLVPAPAVDRMSIPERGSIELSESAHDESAHEGARAAQTARCLP